VHNTLIQGENTQILWNSFENISARIFIRRIKISTDRAIYIAASLAHLPLMLFIHLAYLPVLNVTSHTRSICKSARPAFKSVHLAMVGSRKLQFVSRFNHAKTFSRYFISKTLEFSQTFIFATLKKVSSKLWRKNEACTIKIIKPKNTE